MTDAGKERLASIVLASRPPGRGWALDWSFGDLLGGGAKVRSAPQVKNGGKRDMRNARLYFGIFFIALIVPFAAAVFLILRAPKYSEVKSIVELASTFEKKQRKTIDQPEGVVRAIIDIYVPIAARGNDAKISPTTALHAYSSGGAIVLNERVRLGQESPALAAQVNLQKEILKKQNDLVKPVREALQIEINSADQSLRDIESDGKLLNARRAGFNGLRERQQSHPQDQPEAAAGKDGDIGTNGAASDIEFGQASIDRGLIEISQRGEEQRLTKAQAQLQLDATTDAHIIMEPTVFRLDNSARRYLFSIAAAVGSFLFAIIIVFLFDRFRSNA